MYIFGRSGKCCGLFNFALHSNNFTHFVISFRSFVSIDFQDRSYQRIKYVPPYLRQRDVTCQIYRLLRCCNTVGNLAPRGNFFLSGCPCCHQLTKNTAFWYMPRLLQVWRANDPGPGSARKGMHRG
jgi:hypothetical protein